MPRTQTVTYTTSMELLLCGNALPEVLVDVCFAFNPGCADYFDKSMGCWYPGDAPEIEIVQIELRSDAGPLECPTWLADEIERAIDESDLIEFAKQMLAEREAV